MKKYFVGIVNKIDSIGATISITAMMVMTTVQIIGRISGYNIPWTIEANRYILIYLVFFGLSSAIVDNGHMGTGFLANWLNDLGKFILAVVNKTAFLVFAILMVYAGIRMVQMHFLTRQTTISLPFTISISYISVILPIGFTLSAIHLSILLWRDVKKQFGN